MAQKGGVLSKLSDNARISVRLAQSISRQLFAREVKPVHLFLAILLNKNSLGSRTLQAMGIDVDATVKSIVGDKALSVDIWASEIEINFSKEAKDILREAYSIASKLAHVYVGTEHIVLAILKRKDLPLTKDLEKQSLSYGSFEESLLNFATYPMGILSRQAGGRGEEENQSALAAFGTDLVKAAEQGRLDPIVGREAEIDKIINILSRRRKNNPVIVGEAGVGKTALVEALAQRIADGNVPQSLKESRIISLDISAIMAGSKMRGDVEEKMMAIIREVSSNPNIILFIDEIHTILSSGIPGLPSDIATVLKPALVREDFRCIGATTTSEYTAYFEEDNALARRFQPVHIEETSVAQTVRIMRRIKPILEAHHNVSIGNEALEQAVRLSDRYVSDRFLPDKAIDLLDEAAASKKLEVEKQYSDISDLLAQLRALQNEKERAIKKGDMKLAQRFEKEEGEVDKEVRSLEGKRERARKSKKYEVDIDTVRNIISKWTGIPVTTLGSSEKSSLLNLDAKLKQKVVGQEEAVEAVASAIKRARTGISAADRPWASFLFLGPTGVGKTETAKVLTKELFGDEDRLIQIDMSELMEMHSVSKLIGSPPGYVGYREGGQLTERIKQQPHSVILFDEIEKAHVDVLNILLQILEYGHLTDGKGRKVNFKNTVVILTSNIGAEDIRRNKVLGFVADKDEEGARSDKEIEAAYEGMKDELDRKVKEVLRPELINRLDDIVIFRALTRKDARKIVDLLVGELNDRLKEQKLRVQIDKTVKDFVIEKGFSEEYGARPLRRTLQDRVENVLANYLLSKGERKTVEKIMTLALTLKNNEIEVVKK